MSRNAYAAVFICLVIAVGALSVVCPDESSADRSVTISGIDAHCFSDDATFAAGGSTTFEIMVSNNSADTYEISVSAAMSPSNHVGADVTQPSKSLDAGETMNVVVKPYANSTAVSGNYTVTVTITARDITSGSDTASGTMTFDIKLTSHYSSEGYNNRILGLIDSPLDEPLIAAAITLLIWIAIAIVLDITITRFLGKRADMDQHEEGIKDAKGAGRYIAVLVMLIGVPQSIRVSGIDETIIATVSDVVSVLLCINVAYVVWKIYKVVMYDIIIRRDKNDRVDDSLYPLVKMIGKTVILIMTVSVVLSIYGLDLGTIVTSAGIVTLAVSFGAQSTLNQFFSGLVLLVTRPFRIGDKVRLGTSSEVLIVRKIGVMETEFKVWLNEEIQHIPNSTVMSSSIINITKGDKCYKVVDYIDIDYEADIDKAREIMMNIVQAHPKIVNDGSKSRPDFRFSSMEDSCIRIRLSYIVYDHELWHSVSCQVKEAIYRKFRAEGIKVPHNIVDVHMR